MEVQTTLSTATYFHSELFPGQMRYSIYICCIYSEFTLSFPTIVPGQPPVEGVQEHADQMAKPPQLAP